MRTTQREERSKPWEKVSLKPGTVIHLIKFITRVKNIWQAGCWELKNGGRESSGVHTQSSAALLNQSTGKCKHHFRGDAVMQRKMPLVILQFHAWVPLTCHWRMAGPRWKVRAREPGEPNRDWDGRGRSEFPAAEVWTSEYKQHGATDVRPSTFYPSWRKTDVSLLPCRYEQKMQLIQLLSSHTLY